MPDWKKAGIVAGSAFLVSVLIGLISDVAFLLILLRALLFSVLFFGTFVGIWFLFSRFLPELLSSRPQSGSEEEAEAAGSRLDIAVDDSFTTSGGESPPATPPAGASGETGEDVEELEELDSEADELETVDGEETGLDRRAEAGYTDSGSRESPAVSAEGGRKDSGSKGAVAYAKPLVGFDDVDKLPDLDGFSDSFVSGPVLSDGDSSGAARDDELPAGSFAASASGNSGGSFDTKEMVSAIQTMLKRDQKG